MAYSEKAKALRQCKALRKDSKPCQAYAVWGVLLKMNTIKKARELKEKQYKLTEKLKSLAEADENYSMTLISLLNICSKAPKLFESSKVEQKRQLINFLLSNLKLRGKKLESKLKKPFDVLVDLDYRSSWLSRVAKFRTNF